MKIILLKFVYIIIKEEQRKVLKYINYLLRKDVLSLKVLTLLN